MKDIKGIFTALVTPFKNGKVDYDAFEAHINHLIDEGVHGLVPTGTTGESPTLTYDEHNEVVAACIKAASGRAHVMAGTGANATEEAVMFTRFAADAGADSALVVVPYYNKPTPAGLLAHFKAVAEASDLPVILYNIPGRSVIDMPDELIARLAEIKNIVGIKDATGNLARVSTLRNLVGPDFIQLSGEDMTALAFNSAGGRGCISVSANVAPKLTSQLQEATLKGDFKTALEIQDKLAPLHDVMFCEASPGPAKYALSLMGKMSAELRLPLVEPTDESKAKIKDVLRNLDLI